MKFSIFTVVLIFGILFSSCNKEKAVHFEVEGFGYEVEVTWPSNDPYHPIDHVSAGDDYFYSNAYYAKSGEGVSFTSTSLANDSVYAKLRATIYFDDEMICTEMIEGYNQPSIELQCLLP